MLLAAGNANVLVVHLEENEDDLEPGWICDEIDECNEGIHECAGVNSFGLDTAYCDNTLGPRVLVDTLVLVSVNTMAMVSSLSTRTNVVTYLRRHKL